MADEEDLDVAIKPIAKGAFYLAFDLTDTDEFITARFQKKYGELPATIYNGMGSRFAGPVPMDKLWEK